MRRLPRAPSGFVTRACRVILPASQRSGGMAEWLKAHAWKACIRETVSWVRIPLPPPPTRDTSVLRGHWAGRLGPLCRFSARTSGLHEGRPRVLMFSDRLVFSEALYDCDLVQSSAGPNLRASA